MILRYKHYIITNILIDTKALHNTHPRTHTQTHTRTQYLRIYFSYYMFQKPFIFLRNQENNDYLLKIYYTYKGKSEVYIYIHIYIKYKICQNDFGISNSRMMPRHSLTLTAVKLTFKQTVTLIYDTYLFLTQIGQINVIM